MSIFTHLNLIKDAGLQSKFAQVKANDKYFNIKKTKTSHFFRKDKDFKWDL